MPGLGRRSADGSYGGWNVHVYVQYIHIIHKYCTVYTYNTQDLSLYTISIIMHVYMYLAIYIFLLVTLIACVVYMYMYIACVHTCNIVLILYMHDNI